MFLHQIINLIRYSHFQYGFLINHLIDIKWFIQNPHACHRVDEQIFSNFQLYGPDSVFFKVSQHCFEMKKDEYKYSICPFRKVTQQNGHGSAINIGIPYVSCVKLYNIYIYIDTFKYTWALLSYCDRSMIASHPSCVNIFTSPPKLLIGFLHAYWSPTRGL